MREGRVDCGDEGGTPQVRRAPSVGLELGWGSERERIGLQE